MTRSYCRLWTHVVFSTKNRQPLINRESEIFLYDYLSDQLRKCECVPLAINGMPDHMHLLFLANYKMSLMDTMKQVKGSSSFWMNRNKLSDQKFDWQDGFCGLSVSEDNVEIVKRYVQNQKAHHTRHTFQQEYEEFIKDHGEFSDTPDGKKAG
jgi:putative transposase